VLDSTLRAEAFSTVQCSTVLYSSTVQYSTERLTSSSEFLFLKFFGFSLTVLWLVT